MRAVLPLVVLAACTGEAPEPTPNPAADPPVVRYYVLSDA